MPHVILPIRTVSESNQREHWAQKAKRAKAQRSETYHHALNAWGRLSPSIGRFPLQITLTRIAPRALDSDNLAGALKAVQDGVADWLAGEYGQGQDRQAGLLWRYKERRG